MNTLTVPDLAAVIYSAGKVFEDLRAGRPAVECYLRTGRLDGITYRSDMPLLKDLRDTAQFVLDQAQVPVDAQFVRGVNSQITRSGALIPGQYRHEGIGIGVVTRYGRHEPPAVTGEILSRLLDAVQGGSSPVGSALNLFVELAKAQPFGDGNKRTALFSANALLIGSGSGKLLTIPFDEQDPGVADRLNDLLARAYIFGEHAGVVDMLRLDGVIDQPI